MGARNAILLISPHHMRDSDFHEIARRARAIALQSAGVGIGLSVIGMGVAAAGGLAPVEGAILQEVIDVAVILNALRALRIVPPSGEPGGD